jgi:collagenase-like PrtC family protease
MNKLLIKAPVNSLESARMQIQAGADEIYLSYLSDAIKNLSFSGRGKASYHKIQTQMSYQEFIQIIELSHKHGVKVDLAANVPMSGNDPDGGHTFHNNYKKYVEEAIAAGIDGVIVGDMGNLLLLQDICERVEITASVFWGTLNIPQIQMLEQLKVKKVCLPHHFSIEEIKEFVKNTNMKIEVFGHFGCSFIESTCSLYHHASETIDFGIPCRAKYRLSGTDETMNILDMGEDCSLCKLPEIIEAGVSSIKMIGRELDYKLSSTITYVYRYAIDEIQKGKNIEQVLKDLEAKIDFSFWKSHFCESQRCKFRDNHYYI